MPSGKVHDRITVTTAALSLPFWWFLFPLATLPLYIGAVCAYIFSGHYLSDDLDTKSLALKRWAKFGFIWTPYRKFIPHRSWLSHGFVIGPIGRVIYLTGFIWLIARAGLWLINEWLFRVDRDRALEQASIWLASVLYHNSIWFEWCLAGLILGGVTHSLADKIWSGVKRAW